MRSKRLSKFFSRKGSGSTSDSHSDFKIQRKNSLPGKKSKGEVFRFIFHELKKDELDNIRSRNEISFVCHDNIWTIFYLNNENHLEEIIINDLENLNEKKEVLKSLESFKKLGLGNKKIIRDPDVLEAVSEIYSLCKNAVFLDFLQIQLNEKLKSNILLKLVLNENESRRKSFYDLLYREILKPNSSEKLKYLFSLLEGFLKEVSKPDEFLLSPISCENKILLSNKIFLLPNFEEVRSNLSDRGLVSLDLTSLDVCIVCLESLIVESDNEIGNKLLKLQGITLIGDNISNAALSTLLAVLKDSCYLFSFTCDKVILTDDNIEALSKLLPLFKSNSFTQLSFNECGMNDDKMATLLKACCKIKYLKELQVKSNKTTKSSTRNFHKLIRASEIEILVDNNNKLDQMHLAGARKMRELRKDKTLLEQVNKEEIPVLMKMAILEGVINLFYTSDTACQTEEEKYSSDAVKSFQENGKNILLLLEKEFFNGEDIKRFRELSKNLNKIIPSADFLYSVFHHCYLPAEDARQMNEKELWKRKFDFLSIFISSVQLSGGLFRFCGDRVEITAEIIKDFTEKVLQLKNISQQYLLLLQKAELSSEDTFNMLKENLRLLAQVHIKQTDKKSSTFLRVDQGDNQKRMAQGYISPTSMFSSQSRSSKDVDDIAQGGSEEIVSSLQNRIRFLKEKEEKGMENEEKGMENNESAAFYRSEVEILDKAMKEIKKLSQKTVRKDDRKKREPLKSSMSLFLPSSSPIASPRSPSCHRTLKSPPAEPSRVLHTLPLRRNSQ